MRALSFDETAKGAPARTEVQIVNLPANLRELGRIHPYDEAALLAAPGDRSELADAVISEKGFALLLHGWQLSLVLPCRRQAALWLASAMPEPVYFQDLIRAGFRITE